MEFEYLFFAAFAAVLGYFGFNIIRHKGLKGAIFGGRILKTYGEVDGAKGGMMRTTIRVHSISSRDLGEAVIGIELSARSAMSYQMMPIRLRRSDVSELIRILERAVEDGVA